MVYVIIGGTKVYGRDANENEVKEWFEGAIEELRIPVRFSDAKVQMGDTYICKLELSIGKVKIPIKVLVDCGTSSTFYGAYITLPEDHPLKPILKEALREFYSEYVEEIEVGFWDYILLDNPVYKKKIEEEKVICKYAGLWGEGGTIEAYLPLKPLQRVLERHLANTDRILKILEDAKKIVDEVEEEMKSSSENAEFEFNNKAVKWLKKRLEKAYLGVFDELEIE